MLKTVPYVDFVQQANLMPCYGYTRVQRSNRRSLLWRKWIDCIQTLTCLWYHRKVISASHELTGDFGIKAIMRCHKPISSIRSLIASEVAMPLLLASWYESAAINIDRFCNRSFGTQIHSSRGLQSIFKVSGWGLINGSGGLFYLVKGWEISRCNIWKRAIPTAR